MPVLNGFVVKVGCQMVVFNELNTLCDELCKYYTNPELCENRYRKDAINAQLLKDQVGPEPTPTAYNSIRSAVNRAQGLGTPCPPPTQGIAGEVPCQCEAPR